MGGSGHGRAGGRSGQSLATGSALRFCAAHHATSDRVPLDFDAEAFEEKSFEMFHFLQIIAYEKYFVNIDENDSK